MSVPLSDYSRFGLWASQFTVEAGEDIRYIARDEAIGLPDHDYWMFDSRTVVRMHFDDRSVFLGGELIEDPVELVRHNYWRDVAWHHAVRREDFCQGNRGHAGGAGVTSGSATGRRSGRPPVSGDHEAAAALSQVKWSQS